MMMMMMSGFVERVINSPQTRCQTGEPSDVERTSEGRELQFAERLVNCSRWLDPQPRNFSSPACSLSLVQIASHCERTEDVSCRR